MVDRKFCHHASFTTVFVGHIHFEIHAKPVIAMQERSPHIATMDLEVLGKPGQFAPDRIDALRIAPSQASDPLVQAVKAWLVSQAGS